MSKDLCQNLNVFLPCGDVHDQVIQVSIAVRTEFTSRWKVAGALRMPKAITVYCDAR